MTDTRRPSTSAPWITAAVLGAVAIALAGILLLRILPDRDNARKGSGVGLSSSEQQAVDAGAKQVLNFLTYSRKAFDADYNRALDGATGALKTDLQDPKKKSTLLQQMTKGKFDLQGAVTNSAFEAVNGSSSLILVSAQGYVVPDGGTRTLKSTARFELTMTKIGDKWLASNLQSVGLI